MDPDETYITPFQIAPLIDTEDDDVEIVYPVYCLGELHMMEGDTFVFCTPSQIISAYNQLMEDK